MYIRTEDGVYKVSHYNDWATHKRKGATLIDGNKTSYIKNENIINQSENLEELCDEFVLINNNVFTVPQIITHTNFQNTKAYREDYGKFETIYGAIWTEWGLKYVAKRNEKGELCLL